MPDDPTLPLTPGAGSAGRTPGGGAPGSGTPGATLRSAGASWAHKSQSGTMPGGIGEQRGDMIGPYKLVEPIGEGGFGVVWLAERREPMLQRVALKIIKPGMDSAAVVSRFEQERQALAIMDHPNVAKVFDGGVTPNGRPYFVMEYVPGESITKYCDRHHVELRARLELFIPVCEAVQHAHTKGIIHRDIKPSNILVHVSEGKAWPKVIDFGVAKAITHSLNTKREFTELGQLIGTPEYMSPEQAEMGALDVDTRTDVYSLGVCLYELLVGALPFDPKTLRSAGFGEIQRIIREEDPPRPSTRLSGLGDQARDVAAKRGASPQALERTLHKELEWIPLRAMRKDRTRRYGTPAELAEDIHNYLSGLPLRAAPESTVYKVQKFFRRNKALVASGSAVAVALIIAAGVSTSFAISEGKQRREAQKAQQDADAERKTAVAITDFLVKDLLSSADPELDGPEARLGDLLDRAAASIPARYQDDPKMAARLLEAIGRAYRAVGRPNEAHEQIKRALALDPEGSVVGGEARGNLMLINAEVLWRQGQTQEAERLVRQVIDDIASDPTLGGPEGELSLAAQAQLGHVYKATDRLDEAEDLYRKVYAARQKNGPLHRETLYIVHDLALIPLMRGQKEFMNANAATRTGDKDAADAASEKARRYWEQALVQMRAVAADAVRGLGPTDHQTLSSKSEVASLLNRLERYKEGEPIYAEVVDGMRTRLGPRHWRTAETMYNFARLFDKDNRPEKAVEMYRDALDAYRVSRGPAYRDTLNTANRLADAYEKVGSLSQAGELYARTYADMVDDRLSPELLGKQAIRARDFFKRHNDAANVELWSTRCPPEKPTDAPPASGAAPSSNEKSTASK